MFFLTHIVKTSPIKLLNDIYIQKFFFDKDIFRVCIPKKLSQQISTYRDLIKCMCKKYYTAGAHKLNLFYFRTLSS
jgi:hypothetical protein